MSRQVAIIGAADTRRDAPSNYPGAVWYVGSCVDYTDIPAAPTAVFEIHSRACVEGKPGYIDRLNKLGVPVFMQEQFDAVAMCVVYPRERVQKDFGDYFTNSVSWMIALAIQEGYDQIDMYGVHMIHDSEYGYQKPSCEYFIGQARGRGIIVNIAPGSELLFAPGLYAFEVVETKLKSTINKQITAYNDRIARCKPELEKGIGIINKNLGAAALIDELVAQELPEPLKADLGKRKGLLVKTNDALYKRKRELEETISQNVGAVSAMKYLVKCGY